MNFPSVEFIFTQAGKDRQSSSYNGSKSLKNFNPNNVLIHDAARPFCSNNLILKYLRI
jgi:2-C-methyl-D-erythritol 4-phosphate cytidylyltransferase